MPEAATSFDIYHEHFTKPPLVIEPPQATVDAVYDAERGAIRFSHVGPLHNVPEHEHLPPLVKTTVEITHEAGVWARDLSTRAAAIAQLTPADERAYRAGKLLDEIDKLTATFTDAIKVADMRGTVGKLQAALREPGGDLPPELARRHCQVTNLPRIYLTTCAAAAMVAACKHVTFVASVGRRRRSYAAGRCS
jgi:hypothetical protein